MGGLIVNDFAENHNIYNVTMTDADTEYGQALPVNTKRYMIQCRGLYDIKLAYTNGESGTTYITIPAGGNKWDDIMQAGVLTLYFQCAEAGQVAEIEAWS